MESKATTAARVLLGLVFFGFGFNGLFHIVPLPPGEGAAAMFINGLIASRYFFPLLFVTYLLTGVALLIGRFVPLALTALAPVIVNITVMHFFVPSSGAELLSRGARHGARGISGLVVPGGIPAAATRVTKLHLTATRSSRENRMIGTEPYATLKYREVKGKSNGLHRRR